MSPDDLTDLELKLLPDGTFAYWRLVHRAFCPVHERELDVTGCLACKAAAAP